MKIISQLRYTDPHATPHSPAAEYGHVFQLELERRYGFDHLYVYYFKTRGGLKYDEKDFADSLSDETKFPSGFVMLNLEGSEWQVYDSSYKPQLDAIRERTRILEKAQELRPDCQCVFFGNPPASDFEPVMCYHDRWRNTLEACRELIDLQRAVIPQVYFRRTVYWPNWSQPVALSPSRCREWLSRTMETLSAEFPKAEIVPILWPTCWTWAKQSPTRNDLAFQWTPERIVESRVSGDLWATALDAIKPYAQRMIIWGEGHAPWDATADWFRETLKRTRRGT